MRLQDFIGSNVEHILVEWESFARDTWPKDSPADPVELRDHAEQIVNAILADMAQGQTVAEQAEKSRGRGAAGTTSDRLDDASAIHGVARVGSGLTILEVVAEYRALRASILRLWRGTCPDPDANDLDDITRFNESVDQSLAHAIGSFTQRLDESRKMFLAILGHDLRNPLAAISLCATLAKESDKGDEQAELLSTIMSSAKAVSVLVTDLIDFTISTLGVQIPLSIEPMDLAGVCNDVIAESRGANPGRVVRIVVDKDVTGRWDAHRLRQVAANLLGNATQHGSPGESVTLTLDGKARDVVVMSVHNYGAPIPPAALPTIFDPLVRGRTAVEKRDRPGSIGLGLYIAREIVLAHGGAIALTSSAAEGTTATVRLPRDAHSDAGDRRGASPTAEGEGAHTAPIFPVAK
ncbi:MAG: Histidine Kinase [Phycisphaerales bacterium]|nr:Histidine Kinase [Phycisphaerales bacterium]